MSPEAIVREVRRLGPDVVMTGHAGSTPAHPTCTRMLRAIKANSPGVITVYGGVYPSYHAGRILTEEPAVDLIVRGEGEATSVELLRALSIGDCGMGEYLADVAGLAYRATGEVVLTPARPPIPDLDRWRVGWELIERWDDY
jgi:anaerobic magnesium-protoporphyrin IX monomethyl ester cyclase